MAISYPLALPTAIGIANITLSANNSVAISQSPFTFQQQIIQHPGQRWTASVSIPPVRRDLAEPWAAFLLALNGPVGTFLLGDPNAKLPRGAAINFFTSEQGTLLLEDGDRLLLEDGDAILYDRGAITTLQVDGANQTGSSLNVKGGPRSVTGYFLAGDYIQIGSAATAKLYKILQDVDTDSFGDMTLDLWPSIRPYTADNATIIFTNTVGRFRLSGNQQSFSINEASIYGISFDAVEAI